MGRASRPRGPRTARFETYEQRIVLSGQPLSDLVAQLPGTPPLQHFAELAPPLEHLTELSPALSDVHATSGVSAVHRDYGLNGAGQTVAIIDSGIAWDHLALGNGFATGSRVVGGWDFAENDANPYDDGPAGFHGTHVAGIIASSHGTYRGVAPGVDMVALRVFDDNGAGYFSWVEQALRWVHQHRNTFRFPITTVNLSLGTDWNANTVPNWSTIEDELLQLKNDGIFIAVAAGNSFAEYKTPGLSYPAASPHVVPVMSVTNAGAFSSFSQRHSRGIAAPGHNITSTVPDHVFGADGNPNDFGTASGTSMAAPYLAGVSALVREAMQFVGYVGITQDTINNHLRATADTLYDAATKANYLRVNAQRAIDSLMPADDHGSTVTTATSLGSLQTQHTVAGVIGRLDDIDYFTFTAAATGRLDVTSTTTGRLAARLQHVGGNMSDSGSLSLQVVAGQSYTVGLHTTAGIGRYDLAFQLQATAQDLGTLTQRTVHDVRLAGAEQWYRLQAGRDGWLTAEALHGASDRVELELYTADGRQLISANTNNMGRRLDSMVQADQTYLVRMSGSSQNVNLRLTNLVATAGSEVRIHGTDGDDTLVLTAGSVWDVSVNSVQYRWSAAEYSALVVDGRGGLDTVCVHGTAAKEAVTMGQRSFDFQGAGYRATGSQVEIVHVLGGGGDDQATLQGGSGNDLFYGYADRSWLVSGQESYLAQGFAQVLADGQAGHDIAYLFDSAGADVFIASPSSASLSGTGYANSVIGFERAHAFSTSGNDIARLHDSAGRDTFVGQAGSSWMEGEGYFARAVAFRQVFAYSRGGHDVATLHGSAGADVFYGYADRSWMTGPNGTQFVQGFSRVQATGGAGPDIAYLFDTPGDDHFVGNPHSASLSGRNYFLGASEFERVHAIATTGNDTANLYGSIHADRFVGNTGNSWLEGDGYFLRAAGFRQVNAHSRGGADIAVLNGTSSVDLFYGYADRSWMTNATGTNAVFGFANVNVRGAGGADIAYLYDSAGDDEFIGTSTYASLVGVGFANRVENFQRVHAFGTFGHDVAHLYDSPENDRYLGYAGSSWLEGSSYFVRAVSFKQVTAYATAGGHDVASLFGDGSNSRFAVLNTHSCAMTTMHCYNVTSGFSQTTAYLEPNGTIVGSHSASSPSPQPQTHSPSSPAAGSSSSPATTSNASASRVTQTLRSAVRSDQQQAPVERHAAAMSLALEDLHAREVPVAKTGGERRVLELLFARFGR